MAEAHIEVEEGTGDGVRQGPRLPNLCSRYGSHAHMVAFFVKCVCFLFARKACAYDPMWRRGVISSPLCPFVQLDIGLRKRQKHCQLEVKPASGKNFSAPYICIIHC